MWMEANIADRYANGLDDVRMRKWIYYFYNMRNLLF